MRGGKREKERERAREEFVKQGETFLSRFPRAKACGCWPTGKLLSFSGILSAG